MFSWHLQRTSFPPLAFWTSVHFTLKSSPSLMWVPSTVSAPECGRNKWTEVHTVSGSSPSSFLSLLNLSYPWQFLSSPFNFSFFKSKWAKSRSLIRVQIVQQLLSICHTRCRKRDNRIHPHSSRKENLFRTKVNHNSQISVLLISAHTCLHSPPSPNSYHTCLSISVTFINVPGFFPTSWIWDLATWPLTPYSGNLGSKNAPSLWPPQHTIPTSFLLSSIAPFFPSKHRYWS